MGECQGRNPGPAYAFGTLTGYAGHDYTKNRAPAYSLGLKTPPLHAQKIPGPYNVGNVDRNGRYPYKGWTMESRAVYTPKIVGPGPLDYAPEKTPRYTPAYSLGLRLDPRDKNISPSAAEYFPQPYCAGGPAYTIGSARKELTKFVPPGPQAATPIERYKQRAPAYSLGLKGPSLYGETPGPGPRYLPEKVCCHHVPHAYSFGLKHGKCAPPMITYEDRDL